MGKNKQILKLIDSAAASLQEAANMMLSDDWKVDPLGRDNAAGKAQIHEDCVRAGHAASCARERLRLLMTTGY